MPGGDKQYYFSDFFVMSVNYFNNNHAEVNNGHKCVTIWTYKNGSSEGIKNAFLVFLDVKMKYWDDKLGRR